MKKNLPPDLPECMFVTEAEQMGVSRTQLRGRAWSSVTHGLYRHSASAATAEDTYRMVSRVLPEDAVAAHLTAAILHGIVLPRLPDSLPTLSVLPPERDRPERAGLYVFRSRAALPAATRVRDLSVVTPAVCLGQLAEDLSLLDLIIAMDSALNAGLCRPSDIVEAIRRRQRGLPRLRLAIRWSDGRSESPWETILRLLHVWSGIDVEPQHVIRDVDGAPVARADLRIVGTRRLAEYDGAVHRERRQHERDLARDKTLHRLGYERYGYISNEILDAPSTIIRDAENALGLHHDPHRLCRWEEEVEASTFTRAGRSRLWRRLARFSRPLRGRAPRRRELGEEG